jgi:purine nucleoside permease
MPPSFYDENFQVSTKRGLETTAQEWVEELKKRKLKVTGSHEKVAGLVSIDPSQTPSGKLARSPFSLHIKDEKTVDGVAIPLEADSLEDKKLVGELKAYTPDRVIGELDSLSKRLPAL